MPTTTDTDLERAWRLLSLLLRIGRPVSPHSLSLLLPAEPHYVSYLCSIPNSPIFLNSDSFVAPSLVAFRALHNFVVNFNGFASRIELGGFCHRRIWEEAARTCWRRRKRVMSEFESLPVLKKRSILHELDENVENQIVADSTRRDSSDPIEALLLRDYMVKGVGKQARILKLEVENVHRIVGRDPSSLNLRAGQLGCGTKNVDLCKKSGIFEYTWEPADTSKCQTGSLSLRSSLTITHLVCVHNIKAHIPYLEHFMQTTPARESVAWKETKIGGTSFEGKIRINARKCLKGEEQTGVSSIEGENVSRSCQLNNSKVIEDEMVDNSRALQVESEVSHAWIELVEDETVNNCKTEETLVDKFQHEGEYAGPAFDNDDVVFLHDANRIKFDIDLIPSKGGDTTTAREEIEDSLATFKPSFRHTQPSKSSARTKTSRKNALNPGLQAWSDLFGNTGASTSPTGGDIQCTRDKSKIFMKHKIKQNHDRSLLGMKDRDNFKEKGEKPVDTSLKNQPEQKPLPDFELYTVEEEVGSGGYGTVYRARRKSDGVIFAIKCPHEKANRQHVENEMKMLERFGGKNSVIKYEGSFKSGSSECLVLEHVQNDRPEILKREIEVPQLLWYGYCMFRALTALHKQGIVHRDVKPGNFLFSRKVMQGFLIDFNLAKDLHQKYGTSDKTKVRHKVSPNHVPSVCARTLPLTSKMLMMSVPKESISKDLVKGSTPQLLLETQKMNAVGQKKALSGQGADGSGVTSAKDATSTRIPSGEKSKEPIMVQGRKALVTFAHKTRQSTDFETQIVPVSKRKRVSAVPRKVDKEFVCPTPMPLFCNGIEVACSGRIKDNEGDRKQKREGPCVGTKGFRAPEVLLRSAHQGPKIDVWSAGVTLLYLMIGRTPFTGEPEQNIKDIAKFRGCEDLWEVAKLHNRISVFPPELHAVQFLSSMKLRDWCRQNTRRPEFFEKIPIPLFDLVDNCLIVNPRLRLSSEEALRHEFFTPCHVELRKLRLQRKEPNSDPIF